MDVWLPSSVTTIGKEAFSRCSFLERLLLPKGVTTIQYRAFFRCVSLEKVFYEGTREEFEAIAVEAGNESLWKADLYFYSETKPSPEEEELTWHYAEDGITPVIW